MMIMITKVLVMIIYRVCHQEPHCTSRGLSCVLNNNDRTMLLLIFHVNYYLFFYFVAIPLFAILLFHTTKHSAISDFPPFYYSTVSSYVE